MSRRDRQRRSQHSRGVQHDTNAEDLDHSKTLALQVTREIVRGQPNNRGQVLFAVHAILNSSRGTAAGAIAYLAQLAAGIEHDVGSAT